MRLSQLVYQYKKPDSVLIISGETLIYRSGIFRNISGNRMIGKIFKKISDQVYWLANPKEPSYLIKGVYNWVNSKVNCNKIDFLVDSNTLSERIYLFKKSESEVFVFPEPYFKGVSKKGSSLFKNKNLKYDMVVIVYNDCLGLGCYEIEHFAKKNLSKTLIIYNGRHRIFPLTRNVRMRLLVHRFMEKYLIIQLFLMPIFFFIFILASLDRVASYLKQKN